MRSNRKVLRIVSIIFFFTGAILGMALFGSIVLANMEAKFYFGGIKIADEDLKTLKCPPIITPLDRSVVTARITNTTAKMIKPVYRMNISNESEIARLVETTPTINPGETKQVEWAVTIGDAIYGNLVLVKVMQYKTLKTPSREGTCGTLAIDIPLLTGKQVLFFRHRLQFDVNGRRDFFMACKQQTTDWQLFKYQECHVINDNRCRSRDLCQLLWNLGAWNSSNDHCCLDPGGEH